jgi:hypothetical protein
MAKGDLKRKRKRDALADQTVILAALRTEGHVVVAFTPYHYRIDDKLDLYPVSRRYHWRETDERGDYPSITEVVDHFLAPTTGGEHGE